MTTNVDAVALKPCPFCGSSARLEYNSGNENFNQKWWVACTARECGVTARAFEGSNTWGGSGDLKAIDAKAKQDANDFWNRRSPAVMPDDDQAEKFKESLHAHFNEFPIPTQLGVVAIMKHIEKVYAGFIRAASPAAPAQPHESLTCDFCGAATDDPWHTSSATEKHLHQCDACHAAPTQAGEPVKDHTSRLTMHLGLLANDILRGKADKARAEKAMAFLNECGLIKTYQLAAPQPAQTAQSGAVDLNQIQTQENTMNQATALSFIDQFEIVGDNNDSRGPTDDEKFVLREFVLQLFDDATETGDERALAIEECARFVESGSFLHADSPEARFGKACAAAMRSQLMTAPLPAQTAESGEAVACPQCGGSQSTWKCTCDPIWPGYAETTTAMFERMLADEKGATP